MAAARVFKVEFRIAVAQRILNGESVSSLSSQYKIKRSVLYRWRDAYRVDEEIRRHDTYSPSGVYVAAIGMLYPGCSSICVVSLSFAGKRCRVAEFDDLIASPRPRNRLPGLPG